MNERDLLIEALKCADPAARATYLDQACGDEAVRQRIEDLLETGTEAGRLLEETLPPSVLDARPGDAPPDGTKLLSTHEQLDPSDLSDLSGTAALRAVGTRKLAQFEILAELGEGGMGVVYKARHRRLNRIVALKMISDGKHARSENRARFLVEAEAVARLRHPNIVQIYDFGEADGFPYVTLELLEGGSLSDRLEKTTQSSREAAELVATLASAMHAAHVAGIVHRDLKPTNILFDASGVPKIVDFGIAKRLEVDEGYTWTGQIMGTPCYMAPEQAQGLTRAIGPAVDIYALGATLYEMLTGRPPFKGSNTVLTLKQVVEDDVVPPSRFQPQVSRDLETICLKCLEKTPQKRYASGAELAADLRRYLDNLPILARRTPLVERAAKWVRRHPTAASLTGLGVAAALAAVVAGFSYEASLRRTERGERMRVERVQRDATTDLFRIQDALNHHDWAAAKELASKWVTKLEAEPQLAELRARAVDFLGRADRELSAQSARDRDRRNFNEFLRLRDEALFHETQYTGLDLPENRAATRHAAEAALGLFSAPGRGDDRAPAERRATLAAAEWDEIDEGCYELLLILSELVAEPRQGLSILDGAARFPRRPTQAYHRRRAACFDRIGDAAAAESERALADSVPPQTASDHFLAGQERYRRRQWTEANQSFEAALRLQPDHFWAQCLSAICDLQTQRPIEARGALKACLQREPKFAWLWILRGFATAQIAVLNRDLSQKQPAQAVPLHANAEIQFDEAEADYQRAAELLQAKPVEDLQYVLLVNRGLMRLQRGRLDDAARDLQEAIRLNPEDFQARVALGQLYQNQQKPDEAIAEFDAAIRLKPGWAPLYRGRADVDLGRAELPQARIASALSDLERAIELETPGNTVLARDHTRRGQLLLRTGRDDEALKSAEAALEVVPEFADARRLRLTVLLKLARYGALIKAVDGYLAQGAPSAELLELRGLARARSKDYTGAIGDYTQALAIDPDRRAVLAHRGWAYLITDAPRLALGDFDELVRLEPAAEAYCGRGSTHVRLGNHRAAVADAEAAVRAGEPAARTYYLAARIYAQAFRVASAEVRQQGRATVVLVTRYQDRAVALAREAVRRQPPAERQAFLNGVIATDPALAVIRKRLGAAGMTEPVVSAVQ